MRDELVAMIAHDLRRPLTGLRGFLELMQEDLRDRLSPPVGEMLAEAMRSADQLNAMISDMLDVSRMEDDALPAAPPADLRELAGGPLRALGPPPSFHHVPVVDGDRTEISCDVALIERVLVNLLANAVRFSPAGSDVQVTVVWRTAVPPCASATRVPAFRIAEQERIFEKFTQLGEPRAARAQQRPRPRVLPHGRRAPRRHGSASPAHSGRGSEFWFWIPDVADVSR